MSTKQNGANATYAVARPIGNSGRAQITSLHRKRETAQAEINRQTRALRKKPGQSHSRIDRIIVRVPAGVSVGANVALGRAAPVGRKSNGAKLKPFSVIGVLLENHEGYIVHVNAKDGKQAAQLADKAVQADGWDEWSVGAAIPGHVEPDAAVYTIRVRAK